MSLPASRIASSSRSIPLWARTFHSSSSTSAARGATPNQPSAEIQKARATRVKEPKKPLMLGWEPYDFSEPPFMAIIEMLKIQDTWKMLDKLRENDKLLKAQATPFVPPKKPIRLTQNIMLGQPNHKITQKATTSIPVSSLPLSSPESIHRLKLLAGSRWTPGLKEVRELEIHGNTSYSAGPKNIGKEGWVTMSCDKFEKFRMNRKFLSDTLERLVEAANDESSPLSTEIPLDTRHLIAKRRHLNYGESRARTAVALRERTVQGKVGNVRGYPVEWLSEAIQDLPKFKRALNAKYPGRGGVKGAEGEGEAKVKLEILPSPDGQPVEMSA